MSICFDIRSSTGQYPVRIEAGLFESMLYEQAPDILIADEWFSSALAQAHRENIAIPANELGKSLDAMPALITALRKRDANRQTVLVAVGGGIVQDAVAFVASVYMRGVRWKYFPTTLLAMADSCIGGKSSINVGPYKNLIGTFHPPESVLIDPKLTITLSDEQRVSGLIEAVKICYCRGESSFQEYLALEPAINMTVDRTERIVTCSLLAKKWFIEVDEFDKAERLLLNFGHSFGHAIEGASHFRVAHGVGVGVGMLCAIELGTLIGRNYSGIVRVSALKEHLHSLITAVPSLSDELVELSIPDVLDRFQADKKHRSDFYTVILIAQTGDVEIVRLPRNEGSMDTIRIAIERTIETITGLFDCKERP